MALRRTHRRLATRSKRKTKKATKTAKRSRGGSLGRQKVRLWIMGYPNHMNPDEMFSYMESLPAHPKDPLNMDAVDNLFKSLTWNIPPRAYHKTVELSEN